MPCWVASDPGLTTAALLAEVGLLGASRGAGGAADGLVARTFKAIAERFRWRGEDVRAAPEGKIIVLCRASTGNKPMLVVEHTSLQRGQVELSWNHLVAQSRWRV